MPILISILACEVVENARQHTLFQTSNSSYFLKETSFNLTVLMKAIPLIEDYFLALTHFTHHKTIFTPELYHFKLSSCSRKC